MTIVFLFGSTAIACSEMNDDDGTNAGNANAATSAGSVNTATDMGNAGTANATISNVGNVGNANTVTNTGNTNTTSDAGSTGTANVATNAGTASTTTNAGTTNTAATDVENVSAACPDGNYWDITYDLPKSGGDPGVAPADPPTNQNILLLRDTMMGIGDGNHSIGPGTATIRFESIDGKPGGKAYLLEFQISIDFTAPPATTNIVGTMGHEYDTGPCGSSAVGNVEGDKLNWSEFDGTAQFADEAPNVHGYFSDGTITCDGSLCGSFGAPPQGTTPNSGGPFDLRFEPWILAADTSTFFAPPFITQKDPNSTMSVRTLIYSRSAGMCTKDFSVC